MPGHEKFIKNMVQGVSGMDLVMLVIAADEGVMPQTIEHLNILTMLGVEHGFVALTKTDLVDKEWIELVTSDIRDSLKGTFLENSEIVRVSNKTLEGIDDIKNISNEINEKDRTISYLQYQIEKLQSEKSNPGFMTYLLPMSAMGGTLTGFAAPGAMLQNCEAIISPIEDVDFAITVYGDSMAPEYPSGSRILIKKINPNIFIDWGKTYVLDTANGVIVKELHECKGKEGYVKCHSVNPDPKFSDFDVPLSEVYGVYRVLMCMSAK